MPKKPKPFVLGETSLYRAACQAAAALSAASNLAIRIRTEPVFGRGPHFTLEAVRREVPRELRIPLRKAARGLLSLHEHAQLRKEVAH